MQRKMDMLPGSVQRVTIGRLGRTAIQARRDGGASHEPLPLSQGQTQPADQLAPLEKLPQPLLVLQLAGSPAANGNAKVFKALDHRHLNPRPSLVVHQSLLS